MELEHNYIWEGEKGGTTLAFKRQGNLGLYLVLYLFHSGTTWLIEMVYLILTNGDTVTARKVLQETRVPYLGILMDLYISNFPDAFGILGEKSDLRYSEFASFLNCWI